VTSVSLPYVAEPFAPIATRYVVATYSADFTGTPIRYARESTYSHATLKAAARRLARMLSGRSGARPPAAAYIITPEGERLALRSAQARIKANG
jgi:hypothetical protein